MDIVAQKRCSKCREWKSTDRFYKTPSRKDGLYPYCIDCLTKKPEIKFCLNCHKEFETKQGKAKYCSPRCKDEYYRKTFPEKSRDRTRRSHHKHREKRLETSKAWREAHPHYYKNIYRQNPEVRLQNYKSRSKKRGIEWSLTDEQALSLMTSPCYYCGEEGLGIDRVDSNKGYIPDNCVSCCGECNTMKMDTDISVFIRKILKIAGRWGGSN